MKSNKNTKQSGGNLTQIARKASRAVFATYQYINIRWMSQARMPVASMVLTFFFYYVGINYFSVRAYVHSTMHAISISFTLIQKKLKIVAKHWPLYTRSTC